ncbi:MAG: hypothetical protein QMC74_18210, partial [Myxococcota bacterium]
CQKSCGERRRDSTRLASPDPKLRDAARWFSERGLDTEIGESQCALGFALPGEAPDTQVCLNDQNEVILPGTGPLNGIAALGLGE